MITVRCVVGSTGATVSTDSILSGVAGDLGRSIARFMVERGARHVVRRRLLIRVRRGQDRLMISPWR